MLCACIREMARRNEAVHQHLTDGHLPRLPCLMPPCPPSPFFSIAGYFKLRNLIVVSVDTQAGVKGSFELRCPETDVKLVSTTELPPPYVPPKKPTQQKLQLTLDEETQLSGG